MSMFSGVRENNGSQWFVNLMKYNFEMHKIFHNWNKTEMLKYYGGLTYWKLDRAHKEERCHPHQPFCHLRITTDHSNPVISNFHFLFPVVPNFHFLSQPTMLSLIPLTHLLENYFSFSTFVYRRCSEKRITAIIYFLPSGRDHHNSFF